MSKIEISNICNDTSNTPQLLRSKQDLYESLVENGKSELIQASINSILDIKGFVEGAKLIANTAYEAIIAEQDDSA